MSLIKSISGIRGTIGGKKSENLTPEDIVLYSAAFGSLLEKRENGNKIIIGRDARVSGDMVTKLVAGSLQAMGFDIYDAGLSTTPSIEMAVVRENAAGGIIITASHNPAQWNALKLLNEKGEFISADDGAELLKTVEEGNIEYKSYLELGSYHKLNDTISDHIEEICQLELVNLKAIKSAGFHVVIDCVNSTGGIAVPELLTALGVEKVTELYCDPTGKFPHNPEPLPEYLTEISNTVDQKVADLGIVVDPDVDRLALICEDGSMFGEEYTLVSIADYVLGKQKGNTVSNLSSTRALEDISKLHGTQYTASAVGEVNVVEAMKATDAVIGGEGNGGIILPGLHYGRDALAGIALFLSQLAESGITCSRLRAKYPNYFISKNKISLGPEIDIDRLFEDIKQKYSGQPINEVDGLRIDFETDWVHLRKSNTEPVIRIYAESSSETTAQNIANKLVSDIKEIIQ